MPPSAPPSAPQATLSAYLRARTHERHVALEAALPSMQPGARLERHIEFLRRLHPLLHAQLAALAAQRPTLRALGLPAADAARLARICADLRALGAPQPGPVPPRLRRAAYAICTDAAHAAGMLYVLEGSRLGGAAIGQMLAARWRLPMAQRQTFAAGGSGAWRRLCVALDAVAPEQLDPTAASRGACEAFELWQAFLVGAP